MKRITFITTLLFLPFLLVAQSTQVPTESIAMKVSGTSSLHDWEVIAEKPSIEIAFADEDFTFANMTEVTVQVKVSNLQSGKSIMDSKMHDALETKKTPNITFVGSPVFGESDSFSLDGTLEIRGVKKPAQIKFTNDSGKVSGSYELNMKDFSVSPPTAMMGAISTGEMVTIWFEVDLNSVLKKGS